MKFKKKILPLFLTVFGIVLLINCESNSTKSEGLEGYADEVMVDASSKTEWVYFSFEAADTVSESNDWDLKFQRYRLGTNSGVSGNGKGGALDLGDVEFSSITEAPTSGYKADETVEVAGHGGTRTYEMNTVLAEWAEMQGMPPTFIPNEHVYAIKTHDGKYVKIQFLSYYNNENGDSGYITFKYYYQPDGSPDFSDDD